MAATRQRLEHTPRIVVIDGLAEERFVHHHHGIRPKDRARIAQTDNRISLVARQAPDVVVGALARPLRLVNVRRTYDERDASCGKQIGAARGRRCQHEARVRLRVSR